MSYVMAYAATITTANLRLRTFKSNRSTLQQQALVQHLCCTETHKLLLVLTLTVNYAPASSHWTASSNSAACLQTRILPRATQGSFC